MGATIMARGGNAVDAAAATALALGVVEPASSGIGGGGFALVYVAAEHKVYVYDFRETAPAALGPSNFLVDGKLDPMRSRLGGLAVGVPGEVAGLAQLVARHGALSWRRDVQPSVALARDGVPTPWFVALAIGKVVARLPEDPRFTTLRALIAPGGTPRAAGDELVRAELAATLEAIAMRGPRAFYQGALADDLVATVAAGGGVMTAADLAGYKVAEREPLWGEWRGMKLATMPLPSSGGVVILEMLGILDRSGIDLASLPFGGSAALHVIAEVMKHAFADRARLLGDSDPATAASLTTKLLDPARLARLAKRVALDAVQPHDSYGETGVAPKAVRPDGGTSHLCVIDEAGNAVSLTTTVNGYFGSGLVTRGGVVLNNQIDDFQIAPGAPNMFGLVQSDLNLVAPGKRPLSSMSPTLVFEGDRVVGCVGGAGGPMIISGTFQVLLDMFVWGQDPRAAVSAPRIHHQWLPDRLAVEPELAPDVGAGLKARGQTVEVSDTRSAIQAIRVRPDGVREAASDPRHAAAPAAVP
ncbi:MAG: gamma-glutamyltransferase [Deltaproteobacteria bacterium]|nr:gamma-glutamyltransferase [Deltaproteobacteria bacterium]